MDIFYVEEFRKRFADTVKNETVWEYFKDENRESTMKDFSRLNVYVADSNVIKTQETPDYEPNQLVSDIGGQLGIWVGISVITLSEVVELICFLCRSCLSAKRHHPPHTVDLNEARASKAKHKATKGLANGCSAKFNSSSDDWLGGRRGSGGQQCHLARDGFGENFKPNEYSPYLTASPEQGYTFEPIERDRSNMFRTFFSEPFVR